MMRRLTMMMVAIAALMASSARAQTQTPAPAAAPDPTAPARLLVEKIENGWLVAPDVRGADFDGRAGTLAGGYVGRVTDRTFVFGAGGYWLTNREDDFKVAYGGAVVEWLARSDRKVGAPSTPTCGSRCETTSR